MTTRGKVGIGSTLMPARTIQPAAAYAGACQLTFEVPTGAYGDNLPVTLQIGHFDGTVAASNAVTIAVADR